ncbi:MAG: hypothetical protein NC097_08400 [Clostridium sp.]|nr:hypothetical protein [Clostridium sp.]
MRLLQIYVPDLITAWIDEDEKAFETMFPLTIGVVEGYSRMAFAAAEENPSKRKQLKRLAMFLGNAVAIAGDMNEKIADKLLDDLSTDGEQIYSDEIASFGNNLRLLTNRYGVDIPIPMLQSLMGC